MTSFRFIHTADIHLDSPLRGLSAYPGAPVEEMRAATRRALANLVELAIAEQVDFVLIAGDLYDGDWKDFQTGLYFAQQMGRLGRAGIRVYGVFGNHDAQTVITRSLPEQAHVRFLSARRPQSVQVEGLEVMLHGQSFATRAVTEDLAAAYPPPAPGMVNIGLLHTALTGRPDHESYAPCRLEQLVNHGYDYWALGHVHQRELVHAGPHIVFPGNLQGRNIRETGPKGASLIQVRDGSVTTIEHRALDVLRWARLAVDLTGCRESEDLPAALRPLLGEAIDGAEGRSLALRLAVTGRTALHGRLVRDPALFREEIRAIAADLSDSLWIEKVELATRPMETGGDDDATRELAALLATLDDDAEATRDLGRALQPVWDKLPGELREGLPDPADPDALRSQLVEVADMLRAALGDEPS